MKMSDRIIYVSRDALARALYLQYARKYVHPNDSLTPEEHWDTDQKPFRSVWLAQADRLITELEATDERTD